MYGLALFVVAIASNFSGFLVGMAIRGLGFGVYAAVDLALVVDVPPRCLTTRKGCEDTCMSFWTPIENPGTRPPRSWVFDIGCALLAAVASFGTFSFAQTADLAHPPRWRSA